MIGVIYAARHVRAAALEPIATGWIAAGIVMLAGWSGMTFLVGGMFDHGMGSFATRAIDAGFSAAGGVMRSASVLLAGFAFLALARVWPGVRSARAAAVGAVLAALCGFMTALGATLFALAWAAATKRWRIAALAAVAAVWIVGAFYYRLEWPLSTKAAVLVAAGAMLAAMAGSAHRPTRKGDTARAPIGRAAPAAIALAAAATLVLANVSIRDKEQLIASGEKVFVQLAPVDPRSLMQGDYMRLNYRLPPDANSLDRLSFRGRPLVVVKRDARGVAQPVRIVKTREPLPADEMHIELTPREGGWVLVSDAWHFAEGDGARWSAARYAEFRVLPDGRALLVGLADTNLNAIPDKP
jgi:uncharacterized membrane-anchored protein